MPPAPPATAPASLPLPTTGPHCGSSRSCSLPQPQLTATLPLHTAPTLPSNAAPLAAARSPHRPPTAHPNCGTNSSSLLTTPVPHAATAATPGPDPPRGCATTLHPLPDGAPPTAAAAPRRSQTAPPATAPQLPTADCAALDRSPS